MLEPICESASSFYGIEITGKEPMLLSRELNLVLTPGTSLARWKLANHVDLSGIATVLAEANHHAHAIFEYVENEIRSTLGIQPDIFTDILMMSHFSMLSSMTTRRSHAGIILSHGYSTATSMADVANRVLGARVYEAINMTYDQDVSDVLGPLRSLINRLSYCDELAVLVDTGSLEGVHEQLSGVAEITLGFINNASTGLAVEVGAGLMSGVSLSELLPRVVSTCRWNYTVVRTESSEPTLLFCSKGGIEAARKLKDLVGSSLPSTVGLRLVPIDWNRLTRNGLHDALLEGCTVRVVIGTDDPRLPGVPFIALDDLISNRDATEIDSILTTAFGPEATDRFHQNIVENLTLRNIVESISILNPTKLYAEMEEAVNTLEHISGRKVKARTAAGLYVHLCCLVERLITKTTIESRLDQGAFEQENADFIAMFRESFSNITTHYHVDVPVAEIAYVYDYLSTTLLDGPGEAEEDF